VQVQGLFEVGKRIRYDITKVQVDLGNAKLALITASNAVTTARAALNQTLGLAEDPGYSLAAGPQEEITADLPELMKTARENEPGLISLQALVRAASNTVDAAVADLYPSLVLQASFGWSGDSLPLVWNWNKSLSAAASLFNGGAKDARIIQAVAQLRSARAREATREQQIFSDLSQAVAKRDGAQQRLKLSDLIVKQAQESLDLVSERYRLGLASSVEQTDAQAALATARAEQVKARFDVLSNIATIKHTIGDPKPQAPNPQPQTDSKP
jgi:outer membrane protein TolC